MIKQNTYEASANIQSMKQQFMTGEDNQKFTDLVESGLKEPYLDHGNKE